MSIILTLIFIAILYFGIKAYFKNINSNSTTYNISNNQNTYQEKSDTSVTIKWDTNNTTYVSKNSKPEIINKNTKTTKKISNNILRKINSSNLEKLLKNKDWKEANIETNKLVSTDFHLRKLMYLEKKINNISIDLLIKIDELWVLYSEGRFGFSVQKKIWLECGGNPDYPNSHSVWEGWGRKVRWKSKSPEYSLYAPIGSLPNTLGTINVYIFQLFARPDFPCFGSKDAIKVNCAGNLIPFQLYYTVLNGTEFMLTYLGKEANSNKINLYKFQDENSGEYFEFDEAIVNSNTFTPM